MLIPTLAPNRQSQRFASGRKWDLCGPRADGATQSAGRTHIYEDCFAFKRAMAAATCAEASSERACTFSMGDAAVASEVERRVFESALAGEL